MTLFNRPIRPAVFATALVGLMMQSRAACAEPLGFFFNKTTVQVTAVTPTIFRISINTTGDKATPQHSVFIDPGFVPGDFGKRSDPGGHQQLRTSAGFVDVDPVAGTISVNDSHGNVLIPPASILDAPPIGKTAVLNLHVGWPQQRPFAVYGCGNGTESLVHQSVNARVGNGIAVMPFFWAPAGFATFVVGSDDNAPAQCDGKVAAGAISWSAPGSSADLYLMIAPTLGDGTRALLELTGRPPVPPRWTMGYMQSRWGWVDTAYIDDTLAQFLKRKLPVDAFIFDFEWYTTHPDYEVQPEGLKDFSDFDWNAKLFPKSDQQIAKLHDAGIHFVGIRKPRLGNSDTLAMIRSNGWGFKPVGDRENESFDARGIWFANADARAWYARMIEPLLRFGIDGWWNDEGEITYTNYLYWNIAERSALDAVRPGARLWTINRAFQPGLSRLGGAAWTGDIRASWKDFQRTPTDLLNWSVAGMPFVGCDIGGYSGQTTPELLVRWMQAGTFFPVMRAHSEINARPHFPWLFGDEAESAIRKTLELRYRLIPILYSLARQVHETGDVMMRPLLMQYPTDPKVINLSSEWLVGHDLLAAPVLTPGGTRDIYLPDDIWYDFTAGTRIKGGQTISVNVPFDATPLYIRAGAILTLAPPIQHTKDLPGGPLDVRVYTGRDGSSTLVEDDGATTSYAKGNTRQTAFTWNDASRTLSWKRAGPYDGADCYRMMNITVHAGAASTDQALPPKTLTATGSVVMPAR